MFKTSITLLFALLLIGCSKFHPYCVTIQQGNIIDKRVKSQLHPGLSKDTVKQIIGAPLLDDIWRQDTWTYVYTKQVNCNKIEKKKLVLSFKNNKLVSISK